MVSLQTTCSAIPSTSSQWLMACWIAGETLFVSITFDSNALFAFPEIAIFPPFTIAVNIFGTTAYSYLISYFEHEFPAELSYY